tara:strand:+ start:4408 stop:4578 length:171 start_codon:yes stop_codon:yes gene_type:complete
MTAKTTHNQLVALRMPQELAEAVDQLALDEGRSRSSMIRRMLDNYVDNYGYIKEES